MTSLNIGNNNIPVENMNEIIALVEAKPAMKLATASAVRERCAADAVSPVRNRRTHCTGCAARPKASRLWAPRRRMQRRR